MHEQDLLPETVRIEPVRCSALVWLRVSMVSAKETTTLLSLPDTLRSSESNGCAALWIGPDQWLLASERESARKLIDRCAARLGETLHLAVDVTAALHCVRLSGSRTRTLLAMGSGLDWSNAATPAGYSSRTRLAQIPAIVHVLEANRIDVYVDRSHREYIERWVERSMMDPLLRESVCLNTY